MMDERRILVTGCGGPAAINFIRALLEAPEKFHIIGTDAGEWLIHLTPIEKIYKVPKAKSPDYIPELKRIIQQEKIDLLHPQPDVEVEVIVKNLNKLSVKTLLPKESIIDILCDKYLTYKFFKERGIPVPETRKYDPEALKEIAEEFGWPVWIRARKGAGARLSLPVNSVEEAEHWVRLWVLRGAVTTDDIIVQEYIPGKDAAWDSLWYNGKLVASFSRERLEYIYPHLSPSGLTGTPAVARVFIDDKLTKICMEAIRTLDPTASGFYCFDIKYKDNKPYITEINPRPHTTLGLWCYAGIKALGYNANYNLPYVYIKLGLEEADDVEFVGPDMFPDGVTLIRHIDSGAVLLLPDGKKRRIL
ncbi:MAG: ATP-grasp domain-containing protein [Candidatus Korarchaeota archaeon]|nr:ATP-grasp domain-containing protein [Thermoproteota archaeon]MCR8471353.1 ATP-grasp domain-containing protein [Thermoproteota archaeon]MCR8471932.1 ATP-grasp domain-containing protein [Thermoproteota archaeon]MCR8473125.1 ATP-grasp domain-containing protein [Thermoproteota archaeon]MCR8488510.1 ATP-grasp domain-containing protein [Thermoproteota archaeon]